MTQQTRTYIFAAIGLVVIVGLIWWGSQANRPAGESIQVGAILSLTGDLSFVGTHIQRGMTMALEDNPDANVEIIFEDDESFNTTSAVNALNKLANINNVGVVFNEAVNTVKALTPTIRGQQIPTIVVWDNTEELAGLDDLIFGFGYSTEKTGEKAANYILTDLGAESVTIVSAHDEWSEIVSDAFSKEFIRNGGRVDLHKKVDVDEADLRTIILQARESTAPRPISSSLRWVIKPDGGYFSDSWKNPHDQFPNLHGSLISPRLLLRTK